MKLHKSEIDMTEGIIWRQLLRFAVPIAAGSCMQLLYNAADSLIVAKFVGTGALASVGGSTAHIINVLIGFFIAMTSGASVIIARFYGAGRHKDVKSAMGSALILCTLIALVLTVLGLAGSRLMLEILQTPAETIDGAVTYLTIYFTGVFFVLILNMESNYLRAVGNSRSPFLYMLTACIVNIVLDYVFVRFFGWDIAGVAIATVLAQVINMVLLTRKILTVQENYRLELTDIRLNKKFNSQMLGIGIPAGLQQAMYSVSSMIVQVGVNTLGTVLVASWAISCKIDSILSAIVGAVGIAMTTFISQNCGAGKPDRVRAGIRQGLFISALLTVLLGIGLKVFALPVIRLITDDPEVVEESYKIISFFAMLYITWTLVEIMSGVLRGYGDAVRPVIITAIGIGVVRILYILFIYPYLGTMEALSAIFIISWAATGIALVIYYLIRKKKGYLK